MTCTLEWIKVENFVGINFSLPENTGRFSATATFAKPSIVGTRHDDSPEVEGKPTVVEFQPCSDDRVSKYYSFFVLGSFDSARPGGSLLQQDQIECHLRGWFLFCGIWSWFSYILHIKMIFFKFIVWKKDHPSGSWRKTRLFHGNQMESLVTILELVFDFSMTVGLRFWTGQCEDCLW